MRWLALLLPALLGAGCDLTESPSSGFPVHGAALQVSGPLPFAADQGTAVEGVAACAPAGAAPYPLAWGEVVASDQAGVCALLGAGEEKASRLTVRLLVALPGPAGSAVALKAGVYPVASAAGDGSGPWAMASVVASDDRCGLGAIPAVDGVVTVTAVGAAQLQGTVMADLAGGGSVQGSFGVDLCAASLAGDACAGPPALASPACAP